MSADSCGSSLVCLLLRRPPSSPLFPYTTLFRSERATLGVGPAESSTPTGLRTWVRTDAGSCVTLQTMWEVFRNAVGAVVRHGRLHRVARCSHPWAEGRNPVGVRQMKPEFRDGGF